MNYTYKTPGQIFHEEHGKDCVTISSSVVLPTRPQTTHLAANGWRVYSDGAYRSLDSMGPLFDVPTDARVCLTLKIAFWQELTARATEEFKTMKARLAGKELEDGAAPSVSGPDEAVSILEGLRKKVREFRAEAEQLRKKLAALTPPSHPVPQPEGGGIDSMQRSIRAAVEKVRI